MYPCVAGRSSGQTRFAYTNFPIRLFTGNSMTGTAQPSPYFTHLIREEIRNSTLRRQTGGMYNVTRQTIRKWQNRESPEDKSHAPEQITRRSRPSRSSSCGGAAQGTLLLPTDDLLAVTREFINPAVSRADTGRCLRATVSRIYVTGRAGKALPPDLQGLRAGLCAHRHRSTCRRCPTRRQGANSSLPSTVLRAGSSSSSMPTRPMAAVATSSTKSASLSRQDSQLRPTTAASSPTASRLTRGRRRNPAAHVFDRLCKSSSSKAPAHPPRHPQTNGMVERATVVSSDIVSQTRFGSAAELESTLRNYVKICNHSIPQRRSNTKHPFRRSNGMKNA